MNTNSVFAVRYICSTHVYMLGRAQLIDVVSNALCVPDICVYIHCVHTQLCGMYKWADHSLMRQCVMNPRGKIKDIVISSYPIRVPSDVSRRLVDGGRRCRCWRLDWAAGKSERVDASLPAPRRDGFNPSRYPENRCFNLVSYRENL